MSGVYPACLERSLGEPVEGLRMTMTRLPMDTSYLYAIPSH